MKALVASVLLFVGMLTVFDGCKKINEAEDKPVKSSSASRLSDYIVAPISNDQMLAMVLSGSGGYVCTTDDGDVNMPTYTVPRVDRNGILSFQRRTDYDKYLEALEIIEEHWDYPPEVEYADEDPRGDINTGNEPLDLIDSALGLQSLRKLYEDLEFQDADFEDALDIYVDGDDYTYVMNTQHEVLIECVYYKFVTSDFLAQISNCDFTALQQVRDFGLSVSGNRNIQIVNQTNGDNIAAKATEVLGTCKYLRFYTTNKILTATPVSNTTWEVQLGLTTYWGTSSPSYREIIAVDYHIDWGDGTSGTVSVLNAQNGHNVRHTYTDNFLPGVQIIKSITVTATIKYANAVVTGDCPDAVGKQFSEKIDIKFFNPNVCLVSSHSRKGWTNEHSVNGVAHKMKYKLRQKTSSGLTHHAKIKAIVSLFKRRNGKWKKIQPPDNLGIKLQGTVFEAVYPPTAPPTCAALIDRIATTKSIRSGKKVKIKIHYYNYDLIGTGVVDPDRLRADYFFTVGGQQYTSTIFIVE